MKTLEIKNTELVALIGLLDEPDEKIYEKIHKRIINFGTDAIEVLENKMASIRSEIEYNRIEQLIEDIYFNTTFLQLKKWSASDNRDIFTAWNEVSGFLSQNADNKELNDLFFKIYKDVWLEINENLTALEKINVINHILYKVYNFSNPIDDNLPFTYIAEAIIKYKKGNPLTMAMFYLAIARRLGLPVFGIDLPHHFILSYVDEHKKIKFAGSYSANDVMFYINPFNKGAVFTKNEVELFLKHNNIPDNNSYYTPCSDVQVIHRYINEIEPVLKKEGKFHKAELIDKFHNAIQ